MRCLVCKIYIEGARAVSMCMTELETSHVEVGLLQGRMQSGRYNYIEEAGPCDGRFNKGFASWLVN